MKKKTVLISVISIILVLLTFLFIKGMYNKRQQEAIAAGKPAVIVSHDKTVLPDFIYNIDSISSETVVGEKHYDFDFSEQNNLNSVIERSSDIVYGRINSLSYTFINGMAWTVTELQVLNTYKGDLCDNDVISLYYPGGFMSVYDYNAHYESGKPGSDSEFYRSYITDAPIPFITEEELFFISDDTADYSLPDGSYILSSGNSSICSFITDDEVLWLGRNMDSESVLKLIK